MIDVGFTNLKDLSVNELPKETSGSKPQQKPGSTLVLKSLPYKKDKSYNYRSNSLTGRGFERPEYNLFEICAAEDADGIIRNAIQKKRGLLSKSGYSLTGQNNNTIQYIKERFLQLSLAQGRKMELLVKDIGGDVVRFHNAFLHIIRNEDNSGGNTRIVKTVTGTKEIEPISALFRLPPETMEVKTDKYGNPKKYRQVMPDGRYKEFNPENIVHITFNKRAGLNFACPGLMPAIDDVRSLRRLEEHVEILVEQHLFPLITLQIGTDEFPMATYPTGETEVDIWTDKIQEMPSSGGLVTSHRMSFDVLESKEQVALDKYLEHFKKRTLASAGVSALDMGEGDGMNRSTADNASKILIEQVKDYQQELKHQIEYELIYQLLLEKYNVNVLREEHVVHFTWEEIDLESMMKVENHNAVMNTMNQITEDEMRKRNRQPVIDTDEEREKLYLYAYEKPKIDMETESAIAIEKAKAGFKSAEGSNSKSSSSGSKTTKAKNTATNRNTPTNQHGTKLGPESRKSSMSPNYVRLKHIMGDFDENDRDFVKLRALNWYFSLDLNNLSPDIVSRIQNDVDQIVDESYDLLEDKNYSPEVILDYLTENLLSTFKTE